MLIKRILYLLALLVLPAAMFAQVTTSSISGTVSDAMGVPLTGATVVVTYVPSGTVFTVQSRNGGQFVINNVPPGGPYSIKATYVGYGDFSRTDINIPLGERFDIKIELTNSSQELQSVVVSAGRRTSTEKTGASTAISRRQVQNIPNTSRTLTGLTKLTPQANGNSFAGMNNRYNNITIDGSLFNNNFGRSGDGLVPGGASSAISIDAIDQVQVNIAPYDVRQSGFVGGGINAVTRRGTNNWYGTAYGYFRNQSLTGEKVKDQTVANPDRKTQIYGGSIGGPIIKDKLFFFLNAERETRTNPGQTWLAKRPGQNDNNPQVTPVLASDLDNLRTYLISNYQYDPGGYEGYDFETSNTKFLGRIDWEITKKHRLTLRYTHSETNDDDQINTSSTTGISPPRINNGRRGGLTGGLAYEGSNFKNNVRVKSAVAELNSRFNNIISNQFIASYTSNKLERVPNSNVAFVDIMRSANDVYISFGTDLFSYENKIDDQALNLANNVSFNLGKHVLTAGASFEAMKFANSFTSAGGPSYYRYNSLADFLSNSAPAYFAVAYDPNNPLGIKVPEARFSQLGVYLQDVWSPSNKFKLTYGLRVDKPFYPYDPPRNQALEAVVFADEDGNPEQFDVSKWPKARPLVSPRVGFSYDIAGDKSLIFRGGTGLFTGRIPFIWLVNQVGDNGVVRAIFQANASQLSQIRYDTDRSTYLEEFVVPNPPVVGNSIPSGSSYTAVADDFKMPQVWRSNLAIDKKLQGDFVLTLEGIFTKMVNNAYFRNANLPAASGNLGGAADKRPIFAGAKPNAVINQMIVLDNTNKGYSFSFTPMITKTFSKNWEASLAYTYTLAQDVAIGSSDQSGSGFNTNNIAGNPNKPELGHSNFAVPHRVVASGSYRLEYANKTMATTFSIFYAAQPQERYSYRYGADINGDGQSNDILYIPANPSEIQFVEGFKVGSNTYTAQQQSEAFFKFIENDPYMSKHKGQYMERYAGAMPWTHSLDLRILQDFGIMAGGKKHTLQFSADVINMLNLLNKNWGYRYSFTYGTFQDMGIVGTPTSGSSSNNTGNEAFNRANPKYTFNPAGALQAHQPNYTTSSTWSLQLGLRYIF